MASYCLFIEDQSLSHRAWNSYEGAEGWMREGEGSSCAFVAMSGVTRHLASNLVGPLTQHLWIIGKWARHLRMGRHWWNSIGLPVVADGLGVVGFQGVIQDGSGLPGVGSQPVGQLRGRGRPVGRLKPTVAVLQCVHPLVVGPFPFLTGWCPAPQPFFLQP